MFSFYPVDEFNHQLSEFIALGLSNEQAYRKVLENEAADQVEYLKWLDRELEQTAIEE